MTVPLRLVDDPEFIAAMERAVEARAALASAQADLRDVLAMARLDEADAEVFQRMIGGEQVTRDDE